MRALGAGMGRQAAPAAQGERERICESVGAVGATNAAAGRAGALVRWAAGKRNPA